MWLRKDQSFVVEMQSLPYSWYTRKGMMEDFSGIEWIYQHLPILLMASRRLQSSRSTRSTGLMKFHQDVIWNPGLVNGFASSGPPAHHAELPQQGRSKQRGTLW